VKPTRMQAAIASPGMGAKEAIGKSRALATQQNSINGMAPTVLGKNIIPSRPTVIAKEKPRNASPAIQGE
jgi:hypothetical protein